MIVEQLFDGACGEVSREALAKAMNGDSAVLRLIVTRLIGPRRHRAPSFALPPLENAADVAPAIAAIIAAAAQGAISTAEACGMARHTGIAAFGRCFYRAGPEARGAPKPCRPSRGARRALCRPTATRPVDKHVALRLVRLVARRPLGGSSGPAMTSRDRPLP